MTPTLSLTWSPTPGAASQRVLLNNAVIATLSGTANSFAPPDASIPYSIEAVMPVVPSVGIQDGSFEAIATPGGYVYRPTGSPWTFTGNAGVENNGSAWQGANAPDGLRAALLQSGGNDAKLAGMISQTFAVTTAGNRNYLLQFKAVLRAFRAGTSQPQSIAVMVDGLQLTVAKPSSASAWDTFQIPLALAAGIHSLTFAATVLTGDTSCFLDDVQLLPVAADIPAPVSSTPPAAPPAPAPLVTSPPAATGFVYDGRTVTNADGSVELFASDPVDIGAVRVPAVSELFGDDGMPDYLQSIQDIGLADCWIKAPLTALSYERPDKILAIVRYEGPQNIVVTLVRSGKPTHVHTSSNLPAKTAGRESWSAFVEKASVALYSVNNRYADLNYGNAPMYMFMFTSGTKAVFTSDDDATVYAGIRGHLDAKNPMILGTGAIAKYLEASHEYAVLDTYLRNGTYYLVLRNPWGIDGKSGDAVNDGIVTITYAQLRADVSNVVWGV
jgi:hypothetical protein